jgi:Uma2 family endonuclease
VTRVPHAEDVLLLVEVADATLGLDKQVKPPDYAAAAIPEVWIVNIPLERLECYRDPSESGYATSIVFDRTDVANAQFVPVLGGISIEALIGD